MPFLAGFVTPQDYGATGNGTTDDTAAVQAAVTAVAAGGSNPTGVLLFPQGTYKISSALTLGSYIELRGMGSGVSVINQVTTTANGVAGVDLTNVDLRAEHRRARLRQRSRGGLDPVGQQRRHVR